MNEQTELDVKVILHELGTKIGNLEIENSVLKAELTSLRDKLANVKGAESNVDEVENG